MAKILGLAALLLVSLLLIAGNSLAADINNLDEETPAVAAAGIEAATFGGKFWKPWFPFWQPSYCAWDYWTNGAFEIVYNGAVCSQVTPGWAE